MKIIKYCVLGGAMCFEACCHAFGIGHAEVMPTVMNWFMTDDNTA